MPSLLNASSRGARAVLLAVIYLTSVAAVATAFVLPSVTVCRGGTKKQAAGTDRGSRRVAVPSFSPRSSGDEPASYDDSQPPTSSTPSRADFLRSSATLLATTLLATCHPPPAAARGRATLESSYERYAPRIVAGGKFYSNELRSLVAKNDWAGIKAATSDPPTKKTRSDLAKADAGVADRAAQAGGFSDARVLVACDLYAAAFSDSSITAKTKSMRGQVEQLRKVVGGMNLAAREALGEEKGGGGLFGIGGGKAPSQAELSKTVRQLYVEGGNYWNQYIFAANDGLPVKLEKLPYL